jgi:hypothetical protein
MKWLSVLFLALCVTACGPGAPSTSSRVADAQSTLAPACVAPPYYACQTTDGRRYEPACVGGDGGVYQCDDGDTLVAIDAEEAAALHASGGRTSP